MASELSGRFIASTTIFVCLVFAIYYTLYYARGVLTGYYLHDWFSLTIFANVSLWSVAGISVVLRLLNYLDTRIRLEGWEVELAIRAEAIRQFGDETTSKQPAMTGGKA